VLAKTKKGLAHLRSADPRLAALIDGYGSPDQVLARRGRAPTEPYGALLRAIVGQQLSTKAARTIYTRLCALFGDDTPSPRELLGADPEDLRAAGLSRAKVSYLRDLAQHIQDGELDLAHISDLPDEEVIEQLVAVKGLGVWSVHMFLIFHLGRPDVLPVGDLGVRRAVQLTYGLDELPKPAELEKIAEPWRPWRSLASLYLWRSLDNTPD
jgi:DNA-3-methyladenine glycosylase II